METVFITYEDYLRNNLSAQKKIELESELAKNPDANDSFKLYKLIRAEMQKKLSLDPQKRVLKQRLGEIGEQYFKESDTSREITQTEKITTLPKTNRGFRKYLVSIAAGMLLLAAFGIGLQSYAKTNYGNEALVSLFDQSNVRGSQTEMSSDENAIQLANVAFQNDAPLEALKYLSGIEAGSQQYDLAQWLSAKVYLATDQTVEAKAILYDLSVRENDYQVKAKNVINKLESIMYRIATF